MQSTRSECKTIGQTFSLGRNAGSAPRHAWLTSVASSLQGEMQTVRSMHNMQRVLVGKGSAGRSLPSAADSLHGKAHGWTKEESLVYGC